MSLYNLRNPAVKRLMKEAEELRQPTDEYHAQPLEVKFYDNLFEWHFSIRGPSNSDFEGGIYHGRITLPPDYPMKPPSIILLTPNGRFETNKKICLSISGYHPESWQPSWSIRTALLAIIGFMPTHGNGALGSLDYTPSERKQLALKSQEFKCFECGYIKDIFLKKRTSDCTEQAVPKSVNEEKTPTIQPSGKACNGNISENRVSKYDEQHLLVHRHNASGSTVMSDETSHIEEISDYIGRNSENVKNVVSSENRHSSSYLVFIFLIISLLMFLILRRIFSNVIY